MQTIRILIVEDEWIVSEEIRELLVKAGYEVIGQAEGGQEALAILDRTPADVVLLDINIKGQIDGIELAHQINQKLTCAIIFLTAYDNDHFINRAKELKPSAFIIKPFEARNLQLAVEMAFNNLIEANNPPKNDSYIISDFIFIREQSRFRKIALDSIYYAEATGSYTNIYSENGKFTLAINLKTFEENLNHDQFLRVHRSYLVNLTLVDEYEGNRLFIKGSAIPISLSHKEEFLRRFRFI